MDVGLAWDQPADIWILQMKTSKGRVKEFDLIMEE
jgi:hypothetical protein